MLPASAFRQSSFQSGAEHSGTGLGLLILVPDWFQHRHFFSFRYQTDWMPDSPAFQHAKKFYEVIMVDVKKNQKETYTRTIISTWDNLLFSQCKRYCSTKLLASLFMPCWHSSSAMIQDVHANTFNEPILFIMYRLVEYPTQLSLKDRYCKARKRGLYIGMNQTVSTSLTIADVLRSI